MQDFRILQIQYMYGHIEVVIDALHAKIKSVMSSLKVY